MRFLVLTIILVLCLLALASAEDPSWSSWAETYYKSNAKVMESNNLLTIYSGDDTLYVYKEIPSPKNKKEPGKGDNTKYTHDTVFLVSDKDWKNVLMGLSLAIWSPNVDDGAWCNLLYHGADDFDYSDKCAYPYLIYHYEKNQKTGKYSYDVDSIKHFLDQYGAKRIVHIGKIPQGLSLLLKKYGPLKELDLSPDNVLSYWDTPGFFSLDELDVVFVDDDYALAMLAAQYASYKNAPLIIQNSGADTKNTYKKSNLICIGKANPKEGTCTVRFTAEELKKELVQLTGSDKVMLVNPRDIEEGYCENSAFETEYGGSITKLYCKDSLAAAYLATAKEEIMVPLDFEPSYSIGEYQGENPELATWVAILGDTLYALERYSHIGAYPILSDGRLGDKLKLKPSDSILVEDQGEILALESTNNYLYALIKDSYDNTLKVCRASTYQGKLKDDACWSLDSAKDYINKCDDFKVEEDGDQIILYIIASKKDGKRNLLICKKSPGSKEIDIVKTLDGNRYWVNSVAVDEGSIYFYYASSASKIVKYKLDSDNSLNQQWSVEMSDFDGFGLSDDSITALNYDDGYLYGLDRTANTVIKFRITQDPNAPLSLEKIFGYPNHEGDSVRIDRWKDIVDSTGTFFEPGDMEIRGNYLYVSDLIMPLFSILDKTGNKHPLWHDKRFLNTRPSNLIQTAVNEISNSFSYGAISKKESLDLVHYITFFASPKAIQFSQVYIFDLTYKMQLPQYWSLDFLVSEQVSLNRLSNTPLLQDERTAFLKPHILPYGRIFGISVSDTTTYVARSVFLERVEKNSVDSFTPANRFWFYFMIGSDIANQQYLNEIKNIVLTSMSANGYYFSCDVAAGIKYWERHLPSECNVITPNRIGYEQMNLLTVVVHGQPYAWPDFSIDFSQVLKFKLKPMYILASSCSNLDYYATICSNRHCPTISMSFMRSGAMGYLGLVTSAADKTEDNSLYMPVKTMLTNKVPWGSLITLQLGGHGLKIDDYWKKHRDEYEPYFTLIGDPTIISSFFGNANGEKKLQETACGCSDMGYQTQTYSLDGINYCGLTPSSKAELSKQIDNKGSNALLDIAYLSCLDYLDLSDTTIQDTGVLGVIQKTLHLKYMVLKGSKVNSQECDNFAKANQNLKVLCEVKCDCKNEFLTPQLMTTIYDENYKCRLTESIPDLSNVVGNELSSKTTTNNLKVFEGLDCLQVVTLNNVALPDLLFTQELPNLEQLALYNCGSLGSLFGLEYAQELKSLDIGGSKVADLKVLSNLPKLNSLTLSKTGEFDYDTLRYAQSLTKLVLMGVPISDLKKISKLKNLQSLTIESTEITDLTPLKDLENLQELSIYNSDVKDISALFDLAQLNRVELINTKVTQEDCKKLDKTLRFRNQGKGYVVLCSNQD